MASSAAADATLARTLRQCASSLADGSVSSSELLARASARLARLRSLNAFVGGILPSAAGAAAASDARRAAAADGGGGDRAPPPSSPVDGAVVAVKDNLVVPGAPTTASSRALRGYEPPMIATVADRLARVGAVLLAKTNMDEFGMGSHGVHGVHGACVSPWMARGRSGAKPLASWRDLLRSETSSASATTEEEETLRGPRCAGGSSAGAAVAVAAGVVHASVGSDTGGSVRLPAAYNGLVGYKPSYGVVSRWGLVPYCASLDTVGFITRDVADAATLLDITQGIDPLDATSVDADPRTTRLLRSLGVGVGVGGGFAARSRSSATAASRDTRAYEGAGNDYVKSRPSFHMRGWRVGVPAEYDACEVSDEVRRAWSATLRACEDLGAIVCAVSLPHTRAALAAYYTIAPAEASSNLARYDGVRFGFGGSRGGLSDDGGILSDDGITSADAASDARGKGFGAEVKRRVMVGTYALGTEITSAYFERAMRVRALVADDFAEAFGTKPRRGGGGGGGGGVDRRNLLLGAVAPGGVGAAPAPVDVILTPTTPTTAPLLRDVLATSVPRSRASTAAFAADVMTVPASLAGLPAISVPVGLGADTGLPIGMQLIGAARGDVGLLTFAAALEARVASLGSEGGGGGGAGGVIGWGAEHAALGVDDADRFAAAE